MASSTSAFPSMAKRGGNGALNVGDYQAAGPGDVRSPCPALNALANHGFFPRDGKQITEQMFTDAVLKWLGLATDFTKILAGAAEKENTKDPVDPDNKVLSWLGIGRSIFGVRSKGQVNADGVPVIDLNNLARHGAIEHDVSLTRLDAAQGDNNHPQQELVDQLLAASSDGEFLTRADLAKLRQVRYQQQLDWYAKPENKGKKMTYGLREEFLAFGEAGLIEGILGYQYADDSYKVPVSYLKAFFQEERLPLEEGWTPRSENPLGIAEGNLILTAIKLTAGIHS